jgi:ketosteroid isomerase-like protein
MADEVVASFFERLTAHDWASLAKILAADVERIGPFGDRVTGRERYLAFLAGSVPDRYGHDVHGVVSSPDGRRACARVTEHLSYPDRELHLEEVLWFHIDDGVVARVEVFWQTPEADPGGFGSARSDESYDWGTPASS